MGIAYRVSFFNDLTNCYGKSFRVCQRSIVIRFARNRERAIEAAKIRFARLEHVGKWTLRARSIEVDPLPPARCSRQQTRTVRGRGAPARELISEGVAAG